MLEAMAARVRDGATVTVRPTGSSMTPLITSRQAVTIAPVEPSTVEPGDIVLAIVAGSVYLHLVSAVDHSRRRVQISNNHGHINGWTNHDRVVGIATHIGGVARPRTHGKVRTHKR